jgi:hypothetical protein
MVSGRQGFAGRTAAPASRGADDTLALPSSSTKPGLRAPRPAPRPLPERGGQPRAPRRLPAPPPRPAAHAGAAAASRSSAVPPPVRAHAPRRPASSGSRHRRRWRQLRRRLGHWLRPPLPDRTAGRSLPAATAANARASSRAPPGAPRKEKETAGPSRVSMTTEGVWRPSGVWEALVRMKDSFA